MGCGHWTRQRDQYQQPRVVGLTCTRWTLDVSLAYQRGFLGTTLPTVMTEPWADAIGPLSAERDTRDELPLGDTCLGGGMQRVWDCSAKWPGMHGPATDRGRLCASHRATVVGASGTLGGVAGHTGTRRIPPPLPSPRRAPTTVAISVICMLYLGAVYAAGIPCWDPCGVQST